MAEAGQAERGEARADGAEVALALVTYQL